MAFSSIHLCYHSYPLERNPNAYAWNINSLEFDPLDYEILANINFSYKHSMYLRLLQLIVKEVIVEDSDVSKALVEYINKHRISNIVLGASTRSAIARLFSSQFS